MNREEILSMAKHEKKPSQCDEREKKIFDKSFFCAFVAIVAATFVDALIQLAYGIEICDKKCAVTYGAVAALAYRLIKNRRLKDVLLLIFAVVCSVLTTVFFVKGL